MGRVPTPQLGILGSYIFTGDVFQCSGIGSYPFTPNYPQMDFLVWPFLSSAELGKLSVGLLTAAADLSFFFIYERVLKIFTLISSITKHFETEIHETKLIQGKFNSNLFFIPKFPNVTLASRYKRKISPMSPHA